MTPAQKPSRLRKKHGSVVLIVLDALLIFSLIVGILVIRRRNKVEEIGLGEIHWGHWEVYTENGERFLHNPETGKNIYRALRITDDGFIEVDLEEYAGRLNAAILEEQREHSAEQFVPEDLYGKNAIKFYRYDEKSTKAVQGSPVQISQDAMGPCSMTVSMSGPISESFGGDPSINVAIKKVISGGASFAWNQSLSSATSTAVTYIIPAGRTCHVQFTPDLNQTTGTLYRTSSNPTTGSTMNENLGQVWGKSPVRLAAGFASGIFALADR